MTTVGWARSERTVLRGRTRRYVVVVALMALSLVAGLWDAGNTSLWFDETVSASYAHMSIGGLWHVITGPDPNMSLYYLLLWIWGHIFGYGAFALRAMTTVLCCLAIPLAVDVGQRLFGRATGMVAALWLALSPCFIAYEQTVRSYGLLVLMTLLSMSCFLRARDNPSTRNFAAYVVVNVVAAYTHYMGLLIVVVQALLVLGGPERTTRRLRAWVSSWALIALAFIPEAVLAYGDRHNTAWIPTPAVSDLVKFPEFIGGSNLPVIGNYRVGQVLTGALLILCLYRLYLAARGSGRWPTGVALAWLIVPVILTFVESRLAQPFWQNNYLIGVLPGFLLLAAAGVTAVPTNLARTAVVAIVVGLQVVQLAVLSNAAQFEDWRDSTAHVLANARPNDAITYAPADGKISFVYYAQQIGRRLPRFETLTEIERSRPKRLWVIVKTDSSSATRAERRLAGLLTSSYKATWHRDYSRSRTPSVTLYVTRS